MRVHASGVAGKEVRAVRANPLHSRTECRQSPVARRLIRSTCPMGWPLAEQEGAGMISKISLAILLGATLALSGCFEELTGNDKSGNKNPDPPAAINQAPTISGAPPPSVVEGQPYEFTPMAADPDGDELQFSISRKPAWATFDTTTGRLAGTPDAQDVGNFTNIGISVSDGQATTNLTDFNITVNAIALGSATLSWNPPTENVDGTALTDLSGYRIYYGRSATQLNQSVVLNNPGLTRYVVENLAPAQWHFAMTSVNSSGVESGRSPTVSKTIT